MQGVKVTVEYCWVTTQGTGRSGCGLSGSSVLGFPFQLDSTLVRIQLATYRGADKSLARPGGETSYSDQTLTFSSHSKKKIRRLSVQPGLHGSNDLRVGRKMGTFQLFFQSGRAKDLQAPLYIQTRLSPDLPEH